MRHSSKRKKSIPFSSKQLIVGGGIILIAIVLVLIVFSAIKGGNAKNYGLYMKGSELLYTDATEAKPKQMTNNLVTGNSMDQFDLEYMGNTYTHLFQMNEDESVLFFPSEMKGFSRYTLCYREIGKTNQEAVKIAAEVNSYAVNEEGTIVTYLSQGILYRHDLKEREQIAGEVSSFYASKDGQKVFYVTYDGTVYLKDQDKDAEKIDEKISAIEQVSEDFSTIYYTKDYNLYMKQSGEKAKSIASEVYAVLEIYESGELYYVKDVPETLALKDYVEDDVKESDEAYAQKEEIRKVLQEQKMERHSYELFYYDGEKVKSVAKNVEYYDAKTATERPVVVYSTCDTGKIAKVKLSEISYAWNIEEQITSAIEATKQYHVAAEGNVTSIEEKNIATVLLAENGDTMYFVAGEADAQSGTLYKVSISGEKAKKAQQYDTEVYANYIDFVGEDGAFYYKEVGEVNHIMQGELFVNKKSADVGVKLGSAVCYRETDEDTVYFIKNWEYQKSMGVLKQYKGNKTVQITDAAHSFSVASKGKVLYISDYDVEKYVGNLYLYEKGKAFQVDREVVAIIQPK